MTANLAHFSLNADDVPATRRFYEAVFGWTFTPWGPPGFFRITTGTEGEPGIPGAIQQRRELIAGQPTVSPECTFAVDDVEEIVRVVRANGGTILLDRFTISGVGHLVFFQDPAGNAIGAMQHHPGAQ